MLAFCTLVLFCLGLFPFCSPQKAPEQYFFWNGPISPDVFLEDGVFLQTHIGEYTETGFPGNRAAGHTWTADVPGDGMTLFLFGGVASYGGSCGDRNDFWSFRLSDSQWRWISGDSLVAYPMSGESDSCHGDMGSVGSFSTNYIPSSRFLGRVWKMSDTQVWLFGGRGHTPEGYMSGGMSSLFEVNPVTLEWAHIDGALLDTDNLNVGTGSEFGTSATPGGNYASHGWVLSETSVYLYGGIRGTSYNSGHMWEFCLSCGGWRHISGGDSMTWNVVANYPPEIGQGGLPYTPGSRSAGAHWTWADSEDELRFYLYGGRARPITFLSEADLWWYSPTSESWTWAGGPNRTAQSDDIEFEATYGTLERLAFSSGVHPGGVAYGTFFDSNGYFYLINGLGPDTRSDPKFSEGMWMYNPVDELWAWFRRGITDAQFEEAGRVMSASDCPGQRHLGMSWSVKDYRGRDIAFVYGGELSFDTMHPSEVFGDLWSLMQEGPAALSVLEIVGISVGIVAAIAIAVCVLAAIVVGMCCCLGRARRRRGSGKGDADSGSLPTGTSLRKIDELEGETTEDDQKTIAQIEFNTSLYEIDFDEIHVKKKLGSGGFGIVFLADWQGVSVAFKCFKILDFVAGSGSSGSDFSGFEREVSVMASANGHPSILRFLGATLRPPRVGLLTEYCENGDLQNYLSTKGTECSLKDRLRMIGEIASACAFLHSRSIIHRDLKPLNILVHSDLGTRVSDFGLSRMIESAQSSKTRRIGTSGFMAPEVVRGDPYSFAADVYSFSILAWCVCAMSWNPFEHIDLSSVSSIDFKAATDPSCRPRLEGLPIELDERIRELLVRCWDEDIDKRFKMSEVGKVIDECLA